MERNFVSDNATLYKIELQVNIKYIVQHILFANCSAVNSLYNDRTPKIDLDRVQTKPFTCPNSNPKSKLTSNWNLVLYPFTVKEIKSARANVGPPKLLVASATIFLIPSPPVAYRCPFLRGWGWVDDKPGIEATIWRQFIEGRVSFLVRPLSFSLSLFPFCHLVGGH